MEEIRKIEYIIEKTNVSYELAHKTLLACNGDQFKAVEKLNDLDTDRGTYTERIHVEGNNLLEKIKDLIREGNVTRIIIKSKGKVMLDIPVTVGAVGVVLAPYAAAIGAVAMLVTDCTLEIEKKY
ncbi:DUF4342 domain-containing protein [Proteinivorax hydrogeniformans]|uniref:DUF4342 domain-containing protein n=1 Tax=Proteinivorax hydrogeniformans TaxID=1826727 RepID=A0AAU8HWN8_9FIRM